VTSFVQENLAGIRVVHAFTREKFERERFDALSAKQKQKGFKVVFWHTLYWPIAHLLCGIQFTIAILFGGLFFINGELSAGSFVAFTFLMNSMIWPVQELGRIITEMSRSVVSLTRINGIMKEEHENAKDSAHITKGEIRGEIVFENVGLSYADGSPALDDVSFEAREGRKIALLGTTGSGKTSIVNLIPRFYDHTKGRILLDGRKIESYDRRFLRSIIGIVEQDPFLFSATVAENIAYGASAEPLLADIECVARAAAIHDTISGFPEGYSTRIGEKGVNLSGGQKQRIAIARALLKKPRILIFDDSMSAVDPDTEQLIRVALDLLTGGRTTFIIAHRVRTLMSSDLILVLDEGRIVQRGTHTGLVSEKGFYRDVFIRQTYTGRDSGFESEHRSTGNNTEVFSYEHD
jgi:ATP-binding cassette subfamily B protein